MANVAEVFVETLVKAGVERVYGVAGDSLNGLTDAIRAHDGIEWKMMRHEEVAAFAAGGEAQITGKLTVCAGSCGPGNTHLMNGLHDCHRSRVPVLAIAAQIPSAQIGTNYFQETKPEQLFVTCSDFCEVVSTPEQIPRVLAIAMRTAIAKRCVAVVVIPGDVLTKTCPAKAIELGISGPAAYVMPPVERLGVLFLRLFPLPGFLGGRLVSCGRLWGRRQRLLRQRLRRRNCTAWFAGRSCHFSIGNPPVL